MEKIFYFADTKDSQSHAESFSLRIVEQYSGNSPYKTIQNGISKESK